LATTHPAELKDYWAIYVGQGTSSNTVTTSEVFKEKLGTMKEFKATLQLKKGGPPNFLQTTIGDICTYIMGSR